MTFSLSQLRGFIAVAEQRHFGRAAEALRMTQPPLSRQVQALERDVGVRLLDRGANGATLTAAGEIFLRDARRIIALADAAPDAAQRVASGRAGRVQIGFTSTAALSVLDLLLAEITTELAQLQVSLRELPSAQQFQALDDGTIDLGLAHPPVPEASLSSLLIATEPLVLALPVGHHLSEPTQPISVGALGDESFIGLTAESSRYLNDLSAKIIGTERLQVVQRVEQVPTMLAMVRSRRGLALVPSSAQAMRLDGVCFREVAGIARTPVEVHACWNSDTSNPALINIVSYLRARMINSASQKDQPSTNEQSR